MRARGVAFWAVLMLAVVTWAQAANPAAKIQAGDLLRLICAEEPALNRDYKVTDDGLVLIDFLGAVRVAGLTEKEAADRISKQLVDDRILRKATVSITIIKAEVKLIKFGGAVGLQAETPFRPGIRLSDIIRLAEPTPQTDLSRVEIVRDGGAKETVDFTRFDPATNRNNPELRPGDTVNFVAREAAPASPNPNPNTPTNPPTNPPVNPPTNPPANTRGISVAGAVVLPGDFTFTAGMTLRDVLVRAGGFTPDAQATQISLERGGATRVLAMPADGGLILEPGDRISVAKRDTTVYITVDGAVARPGRIELKEGMKLSEAIRLAGGFAPNARRDRVRILAPNNAAPRTVNFEDIELGYTGDITLTPGMTIEVVRR